MQRTNEIPFSVPQVASAPQHGQGIGSEVPAVFIFFSDLGDTLDWNRLWPQFPNTNHVLFCNDAHELIADPNPGLLQPFAGTGRFSASFAFTMKHGNISIVITKIPYPAYPGELFDTHRRL